MNILSNYSKIRTYFLNREIANKHSKVERNRKFFNLETAQSIGIVFDASSENSYNRVSGFVRHLQTFHKTIKAIGYVNYKDLPHYVMQRITYDFITTKDLSFNLKPNNAFVKDFINQEFDLLIDFNIDKNPTLIYITALSKAKFKIGAYDELMSEYLDFMIQGVGHDQLALLAKEVLHYLEELSPVKNG